MSVARFLSFESRDALTDALAEVCVDAIADAVRTRGAARVALSGGSTPGPVYRMVADHDPGWEHVDLALVDERWVGPDDPASNERLVRETFAAPLEEGARLAFMKTEDVSPAAAVAEVEARYAPLRPFDLVVLGMGEDGHTASWFPHAEGLEEALDPRGGQTVAAIRAADSSLAAPHVERMTLTRPVIAGAERVVLMITGARKRAVFEHALADGREADAPVRALLHRGDASVEVYWAP